MKSWEVRGGDVWIWWIFSLLPFPFSLVPLLSVRHRVRRPHHWRNAEGNHDWTQPNLITVVQPTGNGDAFFADISSVLASEILEHCLLSREYQPRMVPRDAGSIDPHARIRRAPEDVLSFADGT